MGLIRKSPGSRCVRQIAGLSKRINRVLQLEPLEQFGCWDAEIANGKFAQPGRREPERLCQLGGAGPGYNLAQRGMKPAIDRAGRGALVYESAYPLLGHFTASDRFEGRGFLRVQLLWTGVQKGPR